MRLLLHNAEDRKLLERVKGQSGKSLLQEQIEHESKLAQVEEEKKSRNKFGNIRFQAQGKKWASEWEYDCYLILQSMEKQRLIRHITLQHENYFEFVYNDVKIAQTTLDFGFEIEINDLWTKIYADAKSKIVGLMQRFRWQCNMMKAFYQKEIIVFTKNETDVEKCVLELKNLPQNRKYNL